MTAGVQPDPPSGKTQAAAGTAATAPLSGDRLRGMFGAASAWLERNAQAINAINVFPVPDGDTGSNMAATLKGTLNAVGTDLHSADEITGAIARSALVSARGNSGVILSQLLRGFAEGTAGVERLDGHSLARALSEASEAAYGALEHPVEGTILTVARGAAEAARGMRSADAGAVLEAALAGAREALARTPEYLPVLQQAGVVDSGGFGLVVMLEGAVKFLRGEPLPHETHTIESPRQDWLEQTASLHGAGGSPYGYCTEYVLSGTALDLPQLKERLSALGDSVIVAGNPSAAHVHVHTDQPGTVLSFGTALGSLSSIKVDNMQAQFAGFAAAAEQRAAPADGQTAAEQIWIVAVVNGDGMAEIARSLGASRLVTGGQTMNPSVEEILRAVESTPPGPVIILPNNKNVILSAEQAARLSDKQVAVLKTISVPQGFGALLSFDPELALEENLQAMQEAAASVRTVEVTRAARAARLGDLQVDQGQPIGLIDDELAVTGETAVAALLAAVERLQPAAGAAMTLYYGRDVSLNVASETELRLRERYPEVEIQTIAGGQPFYDYILSVE